MRKFSLRDMKKVTLRKPVLLSSHIFRKYGIKKEESEERDENPFCQIYSGNLRCKLALMAQKRYYECRSVELGGYRLGSTFMIIAIN